VYCKVYKTAFDVVALNFGQQEGGASYKKMRGRIQHCPSKEGLSVHEVTVLPHEPHYPDLSPCEFFFFSRLKRAL
jgi:hypothetical protein